MMRKGITIAMATLGLLPLGAQAPSGFSAAATVARGFDSTQQFTGSRLGFTVEGAYDFAAGCPVRLGVGVSHFGAGDRNYAVIDEDWNQTYAKGQGISLTTMQAYGALRTNPLPDTLLLFGITANRHRVGAAEGTRTVKGTKLGARLDLEYRFSPHVFGTVTYQAMELGLDEIGTNIVSPSWLQVGVRYNF
jgi:hypothetical protein